MENATIDELLKYDTLVLTGGEPMQMKGLTTKVIKDLKALGYEGDIILYTSLVTRELYHLVNKGMLQGVTFTLHDKIYRYQLRRI